MSQADVSVKNSWNLPISNPKLDLHNINAQTKFGEKPLIFSKVIIREWKFGHTAGRQVWWKSIEIYSSYHPEMKIQMDGHTTAGRTHGLPTWWYPITMVWRGIKINKRPMCHDSLIWVKQPFVVRQLQEKYLDANKRLYMAFVDLEKAFDWVPRKVIWWALRKLGEEEWIVRLVQGMYGNAQSRVRVGEGYSEEFEVKVGIHQGSVLSPLLFIIVLEALSQEVRSGVPGRTAMPMTLLSSLNHLRNVSGGSWLGKKQWRRKDWE